MAWNGMGWHGRAQQGTHGTHGTEWHAWHRMTQVGTGWHTWHTAQDGTQSTGWHRVAHIAYSTGWHTWHTWHTTEAGRGWQRMAHTAHSTARHTEDAPSSRAPSPLRTAGRRAGQSASNCCRMGPGGSRGGADPQWIGSTIAASPGRRPQRRRGPQSQTWGARRGGTQQYGGGRRVSLPPRPPPGTPGAPTHMTAHCAKDR